MVKSEAEFRDAIKKPAVLVDAYAEWCHPCKVMSPVVDNIANLYRKVHFIKFDVDQLPEVASELGIRAMPTFVMFKNGKKVDEFIGANPGMVSRMVEKHEK